MGISIGGLDNVYFIAFFYIIVGSFLLIVLLAVIGIFRMNRTTYSKCPSCSEKIGNGAIICKTCGVNIHSIEYSANGSEIKMRRFIDYIDNLHPYQVRNITSLTFFIFLLLLIIFVFVKY
jgi:heme/copper-type cytochrome/quinol oxidase subunit 1